MSKEINMNIEVGDYVRTKSGDIGIFQRYTEEGISQWFEMIQNGTLYTIPTIAIIEHSKIISEDVRVGDYVNGKRIHKIDKGIDTGDIVDILKIKINDDDTGYDLYRKGEELCYKILEKNIEKLVKNEFELIKQDDLIKRGYKTNTYSINGTLKQKEINIEELNNISVYDKIRAFDSPYHEPAYIIINGKKVYLTTKLWKEIK